MPYSSFRELLVIISLWLVNDLTVILIITAAVGVFWGALVLLAWITFHVQRLFGMHAKIKEPAGSQRVKDINTSTSNKKHSHLFMTAPTIHVNGI